jgi:hypothetical protein
MELAYPEWQDNSASDEMKKLHFGSFFQHSRIFSSILPFSQ